MSSGTGFPARPPLHHGPAFSVFVAQPVRSDLAPCDEDDLRVVEIQ
jgi:hypothetical protein